MRLVVSKLFGHIEGARAVAASHDVPRVLVHAAWSFLEQREEFSLWPSFAAFDIVAKTNNQKKPLMQMAGLDNDGRNILAAQGFLRDQTTTSHEFWFCDALSHLFEPGTLLAVHAICMDQCAQEWAGVNTSRFRGIFHELLVVYPCSYHKITQPLEKSENLGHGPHVTDEAYRLISQCLHDINSYYETARDARDAFECLRVYAQTAIHGQSKYDAFQAYCAKMEKDVDKWGFFFTKFAITMHERTSNRVEIENAIVKGRKGVSGVDVRGDMAAVLNFTDRVLDARNKLRSHWSTHYLQSAHQKPYLHPPLTFPATQQTRLTTHHT